MESEHFLLLVPFKPHLLIFFRKITNLPSALLDVPLSTAHSGPLEIWQIISYRFSKNPARFLQSSWLLFVPYPAVQ